MIKVLHVGLLSAASLFVNGQPEWVLRKEKDGIFIYDLKTDSSKFNSIKVEAELPGTVENLVSILMDVRHHNNWAYGTKSAEVLKRISDKEIIFYKQINSPGIGISDRDMVIRMKIIRSPSSKSVSVESKIIPDYIPPKKNLVRVPLSNEKWIITPMANQRLKIKYFLQIDPGGSLPPVLVNLFVAKGPYESFTNLGDLLRNRGGK